jgi:uncharacterized protein YegL
MAKLMGKTPEQTYQTMHDYKYTGQVPDNLGGRKYTLVTMVLDSSPSIEDFAKEIEKTCGVVVGACKKHPNNGEIMFRTTTFNNKLSEAHGFKELANINPSDYDGIIKVAGTTALYEATLESISATESYGQQLVGQDYMCNAVVFIITDGQNNNHRYATPQIIKEDLQRIRKDEGAKTVESINVILIAATDRPDDVVALKQFHTEAGLNQFVEMGQFTERSLAKLANFVSQSVSSTSQALGKGAPSIPLTF